MDTINKDIGATVVATAMAAVLVAFVLLVWLTIKIFHLTATGNLGDAFTAVGALFAGLAFAGLIVTILQQRQDLALQRHELSMTREELAGQKAQLEAQSRTMSTELFESSLFKLMQLNRDCVSDFIALFPESTHPVSGLHAFRQGAAHVTETMRFEMAAEPSPETKAQLVAMNFTRYCLAPPSDFSHYFRNLYHVFAFIDRSDQETLAKRTYARMVRAQLSNAELVLLFANAQVPSGQPFKKFIHRYQLFKVMQWPVGMENYADLFEPSAYGDSENIG